MLGQNFPRSPIPSESLQVIPESGPTAGHPHRSIDPVLRSAVSGSAEGVPRLQFSLNRVTVRTQINGCMRTPKEGIGAQTVILSEEHCRTRQLARFYDIPGLVDSHPAPGPRSFHRNLISLLIHNTTGITSDVLGERRVPSARVRSSDMHDHIKVFSDHPSHRRSIPLNSPFSPLHRRARSTPGATCSSRKFSSSQQTRCCELLTSRKKLNIQLCCAYSPYLRGSDDRNDRRISHRFPGC